MNDEKNYFGDLWQTCLNNKKRFNRTKLKEILKRMEVLGHIKKHGYKDDAYYVKYFTIRWKKILDLLIILFLHMNLK